MCSADGTSRPATGGRDPAGGTVTPRGPAVTNPATAVTVVSCDRGELCRGRACADGRGRSALGPACPWDVTAVTQCRPLCPAHAAVSRSGSRSCGPASSCPGGWAQTESEGGWRGGERDGEAEGEREGGMEEGGEAGVLPVGAPRSPPALLHPAPILPSISSGRPGAPPDPCRCHQSGIQLPAPRRGGG